MESLHWKLQSEVEEVHWWFVARRQILCAIIEELTSGQHRPFVVDFGCGTGGNSLEFSKRYRLFALDPSPDAVDIARRRLPHVHVHYGSVGDARVELALASADVIVLADVLEHVAADRDLLREIVGHVRPGAYLIVTVPADMRMWSAHDESLGHFRRYDMALLQQLWVDLPVVAHGQSYFNSYLYPLAWLVRVLPFVVLPRSDSPRFSVRAPWWWVNQCCRWIFASERHRLLRVLRGDSSSAFPFGLSLITVLKREPNAPGAIPEASAFEECR